MSQLHTAHIQMTDGSWLKIEGGNAADTAAFLMNELGQKNRFINQQPVQETGLEIPVMNFAPPAAPASAPARSTSARSGNEEGLALPKMTF